MRKKRRSNRLLVKQTAQREKDTQEKKLLEYMLNGIRDDRYKEWGLSASGATTHLFVSDETPTASNINELHFIEPWEHKFYEPKPFLFQMVHFPFEAGDHNIKVYGYFVRNNKTGRIMFAERFPNAPFDMTCGGILSIDQSKLYCTM